MGSREKGNSGVGIEWLKKPKEFVANPMTPVIEGLMSTELGGGAWRSYTLEQVKALIEIKAKEAGVAENDKHLLLLRKKLTKCSTIKDALLALEEQLF